MNILTREDAKRQRAGGAAALYIALALLAAMPFFLLVVDYLGAQTAADKVELIVANHASMYAMYLVTYVFYGIALGVLAFSLYDRLQASAPATMRVATAIGLLWSFALVASGMIFNYGMTTIGSGQNGTGAGSICVAGDRTGRAGARRSRRRDPGRAVDAYGERRGLAKRRAAETPRMVRRRSRSGRPRLRRPALAQCLHPIRPDAGRLVCLAWRRSNDDEAKSGRVGPAERQHHELGAGTAHQRFQPTPTRQTHESARARLKRATLGGPFIDQTPITIEAKELIVGVILIV